MHNIVQKEVVGTSTRLAARGQVQVQVQVLLYLANLDTLFCSLHTLDRSNLSVERAEHPLHRMLERLLLLPPAFHLLILVPLGHSFQMMPEDIDLHILFSLKTTYTLRKLHLTHELLAS